MPYSAETDGFKRLDQSETDRYKLFLVGFGASRSSDKLHPTVGGGSWVEVGTFTKKTLGPAVAGIGSRDIGDLGENLATMVKAVWVKID